MNILSICIPNYNRKKELIRLLYGIINQIREGNLEKEVSICISDDCSSDDPKQSIDQICRDEIDIDIRFRRNECNQGMDRNFLDSVLMSDSEYCWLIGNDDLLEEQGILKAVELLKDNKDIDLLVSPFDIYDENNNYISTIWPLADKRPTIYKTYDSNSRDGLLMKIIHNSGIFGFLSNVIIRRENWIKRKDYYVDKIGSIFIQMYLNIDTVISGCRYLYTDIKLIRNYPDKETNMTHDRMCRILFGLDDVTEFFFSGEIKKHFKRILTDAYIVGDLWELPDGTEEKERLKNITSEKNEIYRKYYIRGCDRKDKIEGTNNIIYGAGEYGRVTFDKVICAGGQVIAFADSSPEKSGEVINGITVLSKEDMIMEYEKRNANILVANHHHLPEMIVYLLSNSIERIGIII